jgi:hypothetical protein
VLAALSLDTLPARVRRVAAVALIGLAVVQVSTITVGVPPNTLLPWIKTWWLPTAVASRADWRHHEILALLERDRRGSQATVSVVPNFAVFSVSNFRYYALRDGYDIRFVRAWDDPPLGIDYMILKTGDVGPSWTAEKSRRVAERLAADPHLARVFPVIGEFPLPDGSVASVRARRIPALTDIAPEVVAAAVEGGLRRRLADVARDLEGLDVRLTYDEGILAGRVARADIRAASATLGEFARPGTSSLRVHDLRIVLDGLLVNPWSAREGGFDPLDAGRLRLESATWRWPICRRSWPAQALPPLDGGGRRRRAAVTVRQAARRDARACAWARRPALRAGGRARAVGGVPVPSLLVNWVIRNFDPTPRSPAACRFRWRSGASACATRRCDLGRDASHAEREHGAKRARARKILTRLQRAYPDAKIALDSRRRCSC